MLTSTPNLLTVSRIICIPVLVVLFYVEGDWPRYLGCVVFVLAATTDYVDGYLARMEVAGSPGLPRSGRWTARVPGARFEAFLDAVAGLGELVSRKLDSQDVTEEFFDTEARIKAKRVEEARMLKNLEESTGSLKDILEVEHELSRVRGEVEQLEGRLRLLANLTDLTTVTIAIARRPSMSGR